MGTKRAARTTAQAGLAVLVCEYGMAAAGSARHYANLCVYFFLEMYFF